MKKFAAITCLLVLMASVASANTLTTLGVANTPGNNGTNFVSDLTVTNLGDSASIVTLKFVPSTPIAGLEPVTTSIAPNQSLVWENVLLELFGASNNYGLIEISADVDLSVLAETYNNAGIGTFGNALQVYDNDDLAEAGTTLHNVWVSHQADLADHYRTNNAVMFTDADGGAATLTIYDESGNIIGTRNYQSATPILIQWSTALFTGSNVLVGRAELEITRGHAAGYTSVVDNNTGDSSVFPFTTLPSGPVDYSLSGVAISNGVNGTFWVTDARIYNPGSAAVDVVISLLQYSNSNSNPATKTVSVAAGQLIEVSNVLSEWFEVEPDTVGGLRFVAPSAIMVLGRTSNVDPLGVIPGSYGSQLDPVSFSTGMLTASDPGRIFTGISQDSFDRTNVGFQAGSDADNQAVLSLRNADGDTVATATVSLGAYGWQQQNISVYFPAKAASIPTNAQLVVMVNSGSFNVYSSIIDNVSGDNIVDLGTPLPNDCNEPDASITVADTFLCHNEVSSASVATTPDATYVWTITGGVLTSGQGTASISYQANSTGDAVNLDVTVDQNGCAASDSATVTINQAPSIVNLTANPTNINAGESSTISIETDDATAAYLNPGNVEFTLDADGNGSLSVNPTETTVYSVVAEGLCAPGASGQVTVNVGCPTINVALNFNKPRLCEYDDVTMTASASGGTAPYTYTFFDNSGNVLQAGSSDSYTHTGGGSFYVQATDANSCSGNSAFESITENPTPTVLVSGGGQICNGDNASINLAFSGTAPFVGQMSDGQSFTCNSSPCTINKSPSTDRTYTVSFFEDAFCAGTSSGQAVVNVNQAPVLNSFTASDNDVSPGDPVVLTVNTTDGTSATINPGNISVSLNGAGNGSVTVNPTETTQYTVTVDGDCSPSATGQLTVNVGCTSFSVNLVSDQASVCPGESFNLTATPGGGTGPFTYTFKRGATTVQSGSSNTYNTDTVGSYSCEVTDSLSCSGSSNTVNVTQDALPTATVSGDAAICDGDTTTIQATLTGSGPWNVTWSDGVVQSNVASSPATRNVSPSATTVYSVTNVSDQNCSNTGTGTATVTVNPLPTATVSGDATICDGDTTQIQATLTGVGPWSVTWSDGVIQSGVVSSPATRSVSPSSTTVYTVTDVSDANCTGTASGSATVTVNPLPTATITGTDATICNGGSTDLSFSFSAGSAPWTVSLSDGSNFTTSSNPATYSVSPSTTTVYSITGLTDANSCNGTFSGSATITVLGAPSIDSFTADSYNVPFFGSTTLRFDISGDVTSWSLSSSLANATTPGTGTSAGSFTSTYERSTASGSDTVTLSVTGPCGTVNSQIIIND